LGSQVAYFADFVHYLLSLNLKMLNTANEVNAKIPEVQSISVVYNGLRQATSFKTKIELDMSRI